MFSKLDLKSGYHQIKLLEESRFITAFSTPIGVKQFIRLNFGTNSASEIFQHVVSERLRGIREVSNISDDIMVYVYGIYEVIRKAQKVNVSKAVLKSHTVLQGTRR